MSEYYGVVRSNDAHLEHHGIKGQRWGVRRKGYVTKGVYQKHPDGYDYNENRNIRIKAMSKYREGTDLAQIQKSRSQVNKDKVKKAVGVGLAITGAALAAYGMYKLHQHNQQVRANNAQVAKQFAEMKDRLKNFKPVQSSANTIVKSVAKPASDSDATARAKKVLDTLKSMTNTNTNAVNISEKQLDDFNKMMMSDKPFSFDSFTSKGRETLDGIFKRRRFV